MSLTERGKRRLALLVTGAVLATAVASIPLFVNRPFTQKIRRQFIEAAQHPSFQERTGFLLRDTTGSALSLEWTGKGNQPHAQPFDSLKPAHIEALRSYFHEKTGVWVQAPKPGFIQYEEAGKPDSMRVGERWVPVKPATLSVPGVRLQKTEAPGRRLLREKIVPGLKRVSGVQELGVAPKTVFRPKPKRP